MYCDLQGRGSLIRPQGHVVVVFTTDHGKASAIDACSLKSRYGYPSYHSMSTVWMRLASQRYLGV